MKKFMKRGLAAGLAMLLLWPGNLSVRAEEAAAKEVVKSADVENLSTTEAIEDKNQSEDIMVFNTGNGDIRIAGGDVSKDVIADDVFAEDGSYTIEAEANAFFPYEVQFAFGDQVTREWFMTPDSSMEVNGHTFYIHSETDGTVVTQMSLQVGGDTIVVYPEEKEFESFGIAPFSLLPLREVALGEVDLSAYTPVELTKVSVKALLGDKVADEDKIVWRNTVINPEDSVDISDILYYSNTSSQYEIIVGSGEQLDADAIRYRVSAKIKSSRDWLIPAVYMENAGDRIQLELIKNRSYYNGSDMRIYADISGKENKDADVYVNLKVNEQLYAGGVKMRAFEGSFGIDKVQQALAAPEITDKLLCQDMTQTKAGYLMKSNTASVTLVSFDTDGNISGCLPLTLRQYLQGYTMSYYDLMKRMDNGSTYYPSYGTSTHYEGDCTHRTYTLYAGYAADETYYIRFDFQKGGVTDISAVAGAYIGLYDSMEKALAVNAQDIKAELFGSSGYGANYSQGVYITVFAGDDGKGNPLTYKYCIKTEERTVSEESSSSSTLSDSLHSGTAVSFLSFKTENDKVIPCYPIRVSDDSYGEFNFKVVLVGEDVTDAQLAKLAPIFYKEQGVKLYAEGGSSEEISGESFHDFTNPVQYTASSEDGEHSQNYWVRVVRASSGAGSLVISSLTDPAAKTEEKDGIIYSTREVMLDGYHGNKHDILLANMGSQSIEKISVELQSDTLKLDGYWTLSGKEDLQGFQGTVGYQPVAVEGTETADRAVYGQLWNLAKVRLSAKEGVAQGADVTGTLTVKSAEKTLMVLTLTGSVGDPMITTEEIPQAVKYVPFGSMIQNNNKYSWNKITYELWRGALPDGMELKPNGEIYGVPTKAGEFSFTVRMSNSYSSFSNQTKSFTMTVLENSDANVDAATDEGYELSDRIPSTVSLDSNGEYKLRSLGGLSEFKEIYLDGVKLTQGDDYIASEGSTVITIRSQTLKASNVEGTHTLGMEFRTPDDTLKRAAQNYWLGGDDDDENDDGSNDNNDGNALGQASNNESGTSLTAAVSGAAEYRVAAGDTLSRIASRNGLKLSVLLGLNPQIKNPNLIYPGQIIYLGQRILQQALGNGTSADPAGEGSYYVVQKGDSLYRIAVKHNVPFLTLLKMNQKIAAQKYIYAGQKVLVK